MPISESDKKNVLANIQRERVVELTQALVNIPSPTGNEAEVARFLVGYMQDMGLRGDLQEISDGRYNAIGELRGTGGGLKLLFNGHIDTSYSGKETILKGGGYKTESYI